MRKTSAIIVWNGAQVLAGADLVSEPLNISSADALALHLTSVTGTSPNLTFTYSLAPSSNGPWTIPQSPVTIGANKAAADVMDFAPEAAGAMKLIVTNNNASNAATLTAYLVAQEA